jgi:hypothetical protein
MAILAGTLIVTRAVYFGNDPSGFYTNWYLWIGVFAFFFLGRDWGLFHLAAIGGAYAWALAVLGDMTPVAGWVLTVGSVAVAGYLVDALARHLREERAASASRAHNLEAAGEVARQLAIQSDPEEVGRAICSAAVETAHASVAVLWRPTTAGSGLSATSVAGAPIEGRLLPFVTPDSGAIQAFTSAEPHLHGREGPASDPGADAGPHAAHRPLAADPAGLGRGGRAGRLLAGLPRGDRLRGGGGDSPAGAGGRDRNRTRGAARPPRGGGAHR